MHFAADLDDAFLVALVDAAQGGTDPAFRGNCEADRGGLPSCPDGLFSAPSSPGPADVADCGLLVPQGALDRLQLWPAYYRRFHGVGAQDR